MEERVKMKEKNNSKNQYNEKFKNNFKCETKKKYISQNPLLSSKNNVNANNTYANLSKYTKPFKNNSNKKAEKDNNYQEKKNKNNNYNEIQKDKKQLSINLKNNKDNGNSKEKENNWLNNYISKEGDEELVTSFEKKPSEIQSPKTVSEDSFISELSNYHNNLNNKKDNKEEDIVNYDIKDSFHYVDKDEKAQNFLKEKKKENTKINICRKYNKNNKINDYKINSCKKMMPDTFYKEKFDNKKELKEKSQTLINDYKNKKNKAKIKNLIDNKDEKDINEKTEKNIYEKLFSNNTDNKNKRKIKYTSNFGKNNTILNNSNI